MGSNEVSYQMLRLQNWKKSGHIQLFYTMKWHIVLPTSYNSIFIFEQFDTTPEVFYIFCEAISVFRWVKMEGIQNYDDVIMSAIASLITSLTIGYSIVYPGADQSKHQSSASLAFVWGIHRRPVNSPHKWPVTRKMFQFDDVIMEYRAVNFTTEYLNLSYWIPRHTRHKINYTESVKFPSIIITETTNFTDFTRILRPRQNGRISQTAFSSVFSPMKMLKFRLKLHWSFF